MPSLENTGANGSLNGVTRPKPSLLWPLRLIAALSLLGPLVVFTYATWANRQAIDAQANERIERSLDVLQEHALKAFQTVERSIAEINEVIRGLTDDQVRARESDFFLRLKRTQQTLPQIEAIWVLDKNGRPLVSSNMLPVPNFSAGERNYFVEQSKADVGTYIGEVIRGRVRSFRFFTVSGRRTEEAGTFKGVIAVTVLPEHFSEFYRKLSRGNDFFALVRQDGWILARLPEIQLDGVAPQVTIRRAVIDNPTGGVFTAVSPIDQMERRIGYRKVPGFPVYVQTGIETAAMHAELRNEMITQVAIGGPAALAMFLLTLYTLRRTERFHEEVARREVAEHALKQSQRLEAIGQLTGGVAHDFNNLLMVVGGNAERVKRSIALDDRLKRSLEAIEIAVQRGTSLTRQLLSFSRRATHEAKTIDLKERMPGLREMLQSGLRGDIAVETDISRAIWPTKVDVSEFELALLNLAVNARDAMPNGGRLTISARNVKFLPPNPLNLDGEFVAVAVEDTGMGIPPDALGHVFEPFFTTKEVGKGTGLGLSQVYGFAKQAGGTASVSSEIGKGTKVTLYLPRTTETAEIEPVSNEIAARHPAPDRGKVLLVEDNGEVAEVTRDLLQELGYKVETASDVEAGRARLRDGADIDVVLTDIVMPGGANGVDLARWIRQERGVSMPVILATGYSDKAQTAADEGFPILRKPYDRAQLRDALAQALRNSRKSGED
jgi:two-component system NtrC family sensor kinase